MLGFRAGWAARISSHPRHRSGLTPSPPGLEREWPQGSAEDTGAAGQRLLAALQDLLVGTAEALPLGSPVLAVPSPDAHWRLSLSSPLPPSFPLQFLLLFLASRPLCIVKW